MLAIKRRWDIRRSGSTRPRRREVGGCGMRRLGLFAVAATIAISTSLAQGLAASNAPNQNAGEESQNVAAAQAWFTDQRLSPNGAVNNDAFAAVAGEAASLPITGGAGAER